MGREKIFPRENDSRRPAASVKDQRGRRRPLATEFVVHRQGPGAFSDIVVTDGKTCHRGDGLLNAQEI